MKKSSQITFEEIIQPIQRELKLFEIEYHQQFTFKAGFHSSFNESPALFRGKRLRPILYFLTQGLFGKSGRGDIFFGILIEMIHLASLVHDDVLDGSIKRRGAETMNALQGNRVSILLGDYLVAKVLNMAHKSGVEEVTRILTQDVLNMTTGELRQTFAEKTMRIQKDDYLQIIQQKTAGLFGAACELGGIVKKVDSERRRLLRQLGETFGIAYQIRDDVLDYSGSSELMGKPAGQDLLGGKITLPLILSMNGTPIDERKQVWNNLMSSREEDKKWIREYVQYKGGIGQAQSVAEIYSDSAKKILQTFEESSYQKAFEKLVMFAVKREF